MVSCWWSSNVDGHFSNENSKNDLETSFIYKKILLRLILKMNQPMRTIPFYSFFFNSVVRYFYFLLRYLSESKINLNESETMLYLNRSNQLLSIFAYTCSSTIHGLFIGFIVLFQIHKDCNSFLYSLNEKLACTFMSLQNISQSVDVNVALGYHM